MISAVLRFLQKYSDSYKLVFDAMNDATPASPAKKKFRQMSIMDTMSKAGNIMILYFC